MALNAALNRLNEDENFSSQPGGTYHVESIERPRRRALRTSNAAAAAAERGSKRLSYVEHAYQQLTNDTYSSNSLHPVEATSQLETWVNTTAVH